MIRDNEQPSYTKNEIRGCIDLGSSNFRLLVVGGDFAHERPWGNSWAPRTPTEAKRYVGWGDDLAQRGKISPEMAARAARALAELIAAAREWECPRPVIVATNTLREAVNGDGVKRELEETFGVAIRVLSQREEAALGYLGASSFRGRDEAVCLIDAGGTSTEISWGRGASMEGCAGLGVGTHRVLRLLERTRDARRVRGRLAADLESGGNLAGGRGAGVYPLPAFPRDSTMLVTGGTAVSLAAFLQYMEGGGGAFEEMRRISRADVALADRRFEGLRGAGRERVVPLDPDRIRLFPAGLVLIGALLDAFCIEEFRVTARDLRWGVVLTGGASA